MRRVLVVASVAMACEAREAVPAPQVQPAIEITPPVAEVPVSASAVIAEPVALELHPVIRSRSELELFAIDDGTLFVVANVEPILLPANGPIAREKRFLAGLADPGSTLSTSWRTTALAGRWPDALHMLVEIESESADVPVVREVYRFTGNGWAKAGDATRPAAKEPEAVAHMADGTEWKVDDRTLMARRAPATWQEQALPDVAFPRDAEPRVEYWAILGRYEGGQVDYMFEPENPAEAALPQELEPVMVRAAGNELWVVAEAVDDQTEDHWVLLHSQPRGAVLEVPDVETMRREVVDRGPEQAFTGEEDCELFVPLTVDTIAGDHPDLRRRLARLRMPRVEFLTMLLLEVERDGMPALGLVLPNSAKTNRALVAELRKKLGKTMGTPICQDMIPRRELARFPDIPDSEAE